MVFVRAERFSTMHTARLVLAGHVLVSLLFFGTAGQFLLGGELVGAALQSLIGVLIVGLGVALSRIAARR
ncbi:hypothetical protein BRC86_09445 [Halobacteriales archaeon QS_3_64_16]|jgi:hypothetical protein|nr:MAG: hypothetical protein BRC86_09445 [Halobacteriales archaeon QS_3_64_16]